MRHRNKKSSSLLSKIAIPMIFLALLQVFVFLALLVANGSFTYVKSTSYNLLLEKTGNRKAYMENVFNRKTSIVYDTANEVNDITENILAEENQSIQAIKTDKELNKRILSECSESLVSLIRRDVVNDAFLILDSGTLYDEGDELFRTGLYLRDTDVDESSISDNQDIFMEMGSSETAREYGMPLDYDWSLYLNVTDNSDGRFDFFFEPIQNYDDNSDVPLYEMGYWSGFSSITDKQQKSIKYALPLVSEDGRVYGVIGIGLLEKTIQQAVPNGDFFGGNTSYILAANFEEDGKFVPMIHQGSSYARLVKENTVLCRDNPIEYNLYEFTVEDGTEVVGSIQKMNLYSSDSPYRKQEWALISVADKDYLLGSYYAMIRSVMLTTLITFVIIAMLAIATSRQLSKPVTSMIKKLNEGRSGHDIVEFHKSGIAEIDVLAESIVDLQLNLTDYASRVSRIMKMSENQIGLFMYDCKTKSVFVGESLVKLLKFDGLQDGDVTITEEEFCDYLSAIDPENVIMSLPIFGEKENCEHSISEQREISFTLDSGEEIWLKFVLTRDKSNVMGLVQDITDTVAEKHEIAKAKDAEYMEKLLETNNALRVAFEAAERANSTKTDFLSRMSHDIRTPMNAIIGMTEIAKHHLDDPNRLDDCFQKISTSSRYLLSLINEVLDMSKIEAGKFVLAEENINLLELVDNLIEMIQPSVNEKKHALSVHIDYLEHENVISDSLRIQQVFMNIMSNAIKYTPEGGHIDVGITEKDVGQKRVGCYEFTFSDNGKGMRPEFMDKLFIPFEREEDERVSKEQGTGLGLTITYNIVKLMNGDIRVKSEVNKGTTFIVTLYLPLGEAETSARAEVGGRVALIVDNDKDVCESTCLILKRIGMRGDWALSGQEAVEKICEAHDRGEDYDAVLMDWKMPGMNGIDATREIRKKCSGKVSIILTSAYDWAEIEQEARDAGIDAFLSKPLFESRLLIVLRSLLTHAQQPENESLTEHDFSGYRVLLVEDNELNREIAEEILSMANLTVETAVDGRDAVEQFEKSAPGYYDLIFMDIQMPIMNGYEATEAIRALEREDAKTIPIVAMTANAFAEDVRNAENAGMNEHISKPLNVDRLYEALNRWLLK